MDNSLHLTAVTSVEKLYRNRQTSSGEIILDKLVAYLNRTTSNLAEAAATGLNVNQRHLSGAVLLLTGNTLQRFVKEWRLLQAKDLLDNPGISIEQIAKKCGYANAINFAYEFERKFGTTPFIYRTGDARRNGNYKMNENVMKRRTMIETALNLKAENQQ